MAKELNRELILIAIVAIVAVVGVVGITKISSTPDQLLLGGYTSDNVTSFSNVGGAFNKCIYYQNQFDRYNKLVMDNPSYQEMVDTYDQLLTLYCS